MSEDAKTDFMPEQYRDRYRGNPDWIGSFIDDNCRKVLEEGKAARLCMDSLLTLAEKNGVPAESVADWRGQVDRPGAPGRLRMTVGNALRARAKRRHGLIDLDGNFVDADPEFIGDAKKTEKPDGSPSDEILEAQAAKKAEQEAKKAEAKKRKEELAAKKKAEQEAKKAAKKAEASSGEAEAAEDTEAA